MEQANGILLLPFRLESLQKPRAVHGAVAPAVNPEGEGLYVHIAERSPKNIHILRPALPVPGGIRPQMVMISRSNEHGDPRILQAVRQDSCRLPAVGAVEDVPRQQQRLGPLALDAPGQSLRQLPLGPLQQLPLGLTEGGKGRIQVQVRGMDQRQSHRSTLSARRHFPVESSRVKSTASSLVGPSAGR